MKDLEEARQEVISQVSSFLKIENFIFTSSTIEEEIKELCVAKLCKCIGINCKYNYKTDFFEFFSQVVGEAVCNKLNIPIRIAPDDFRLFRYEKINLIDKVRSFLDTEMVCEAFIDAFDLIDRFKYLIPVIKQKK